MIGVTRAEAYFAFNSEDVQYGIEADRRSKILRNYVRNTYSFHLNEILATIINEYTDWERPIQHPINIRFVARKIDFSFDITFEFSHHTSLCVGRTIFSLVFVVLQCANTHLKINWWFIVWIIKQRWNPRGIKRCTNRSTSCKNSRFTFGKSSEFIFVCFRLSN